MSRHNIVVTGLVAALAALAGPAHAANCHLSYGNGPLLTSVKVVPIFWGTTNNPQFSYKDKLDAYYGAVTNSAYFDWLVEYDSTSYSIARGGLAASYADPSPPAKTTVSDTADLQPYISKLIDAGSVPPPDANTLYFLHLPGNVTVSDPGNGTSCRDYCAYHYFYTKGGQNVYYSVIPDQTTGACSTNPSCPTQLQPFDRLTIVASHELIEAVTDPSGSGWTDNRQGCGEIGDICVGQPGSAAGYVVQLEWSNKLNKCVDHNPAVVFDDFALALAPSTASAAAGGTATVMVNATPASGAQPQTVALTNDVLPVGVTGSFAAPSIQSNASTALTLAVGPSVAPGSYAFTVGGKATNGAHHTVSGMLTVTTAAPPDMATGGGVENGGGSGGTGGGGAGGSGTGGNGNNGGGGTIHQTGGCSMTGSHHHARRGWGILALALLLFWATLRLRLLSLIVALTTFASLASAAPRLQQMRAPSPAGTAGTACRDTPKLAYNNGPLIQHVKVVDVFYSPGFKYKTQLEAYYKAITASAYFDWLVEYNTTNYKISRGSFLMSVEDTNANPATVASVNPETYLTGLINAHKVPPPDDDTFYMMYFPSHIDPSDGTGPSCIQNGNYCAYHSSVTVGGHLVRYGVMPDMEAGGCAQGCGPPGFDSFTDVSAHELIEAVTDPDNGTGWLDPNPNQQTNCGEIGDICATGGIGETGTVAGFVVQKEWSNKNNACIVTDPSVMPNDFTIAVVPSTLTVTAGGTATATVTLTKVSGGGDTATLSALSLPTGVTAAFAPASASTAGGTSTLTLTAGASAAPGSSHFSVKAAGTSVAPTADVQLVVAAPPDMAGGVENGGGSGGSGGGGSGGSGGGGSGGTGHGGNGSHGGCVIAGAGVDGGAPLLLLLALLVLFSRAWLARSRSSS